MTCSPGTLGDRLVPDTIGSVNVSYACQAHDFAYASLHTTTRRFADAQFYRNLLAAGRRLAGPARRSYRARAFAYWLLVRLLGGFSWRRGLDWRRG